MEKAVRDKAEDRDQVVWVAPRRLDQAEIASALIAATGYPIRLANRVTTSTARNAARRWRANRMSVRGSRAKKE